MFRSLDFHIYVNIKIIFFFFFTIKSWILLKLVWTNALFMDKSRKQAKKLSKVSLENSNLFGFSLDLYYL